MWMTRVSIAQPVFAAMVMLALCVLGIFSYARLGVEQLPDIKPPVAFIDIRYPGASPEAVEREITRRVDEAVNGVAGVKRITSRAFEGRSQTSVEFSLNADMGRAVQDVRDRVALVQPVFPKDAKAPVIARANNENAQPVAVFALLSPSKSPRELSMIAELLVSRRFQRVDGVSSVELAGLATREVRVDLSIERLQQFGITAAEIAAALKEQNNDQPVGLLSNPTSDAMLRVEGRVNDPLDFANFMIAKRDGIAVLLSDLGRVYERERELDTLARINGQRAVSFNVFKQQDANIVATGDAIKQAADELRPLLGDDVELRLIYASSDWVKQSLNGLQRTLIEGAVLTVLIVYLFLHSWRSTVITGLTLPIAVISSFIAVYAFGFTLNFMTMMALSLCIGLLIDDAIVVRENIVRHVHMGKSHRQAAQDGTEEIGLAVMATSFAICAVFVPVAFMGGIIGKFFYPFGITVAVAVLVSLFVSFTLDPMLSSIWHDPDGQSHRRIPVLRHAIGAVDAMMQALHDRYTSLIAWIFDGRGFRLFWVIPFSPRAIVLWIGAISFVLAILLIKAVGTEFVPETDNGFTQLSVRLPVGASLQRGSDKIAQVEEAVRLVPGIATISTSVGGTGSGFLVGRNQATLNISLTPRNARDLDQKAIEQRLRKAIATIPGIEASVGTERPIYVAVLGTDPKQLVDQTLAFAKKMESIPGITDIDVSAKPGLPTFAVRLDRIAMRELGLNSNQLASSLRAFVNGEVATFWTAGDGEQVEVLLRLPAESRERIEQIRDLPIAFSKEGKAITLSRIASVDAVENPEVIRRQDLLRREAIFAGVQNRPAGDVGADVQKLVKQTQLPEGMRFDVGGATKEQQEAFAALLAAMSLAIIFIYIVLASQFGSLLQPIAIMASLPLALIGVVLALLLFGSTLNVFSMIGLIMLMGLVTKNAILLVDFANQARAAGATVREALMQAGQVRMRPIMMTTFAMVFGMLPLALALNEGGEIQAPMGRAIIGGVITSTLLTLVVVPVIYSYLVRDKPGATSFGA
ncbi:MAG: efflux RND transporter permease subunit [Betaproteobacteria bacterium]|nr:efflux RND transporter permease subunit [Pseudomonadota bacterium]NBO12479.1 efflux RND transporter permease subunit [Betaproteobacteria bacterium]NBO44508.1 efflux RND transporter permease subunit [Betaproteobacteria bacterium]NBP10964.1 efflux RND transporter permease subunit [Betaproteobacteria bacterium]NBQ09958.1 efflux RND transporter permease subunit [Betaproteobacteria bacterium]